MRKVFFIILIGTIQTQLWAAPTLAVRSMVFIEQQPTAQFKITMLISRLLVDEIAKRGPRRDPPLTLHHYFEETIGKTQFYSGSDLCRWNHARGNLNEEAIYLHAYISCPKIGRSIDWSLTFLSHFPPEHHMLVSIITAESTDQVILTSNKYTLSYYYSRFKSVITDGFAFVGAHFRTWQNIDDSSFPPLGFWIVAFCLLILISADKFQDMQKFIAAYTIPLFVAFLMAAFTTLNIDAKLAVSGIILSGLYFLGYCLHNRKPAMPSITLAIIGICHGILIFQLLPLDIQGLPIKTMVSGFQLGAALGLMLSLLILWPIIRWTIMALPDRKIVPNLLRMLLFLLGIASLVSSL